MRALVVTNMWPSPTVPQRGIFVADQVDALRRRADTQVDVFAFKPGPRALLRACAQIGSATAGQSYDIVHAHFGLSAYPALAARRGPVVVTLHGNDLFVARSRLATLSILGRTALPAAVSRAFAANLPGAGTSRRVAVLPVGISLERFRPIPRAEARRRLDLDPDRPFLLFPHDPARPLKRFDRARAVAEAAGVRLVTLGAVAPDRVPYWINAANAVLVPSQDEGFGLSVIEALACDVPVFATPVGIHPVALDGIGFCEPFDRDRWRAALTPILDDKDPRVEGRKRAELFSADRMAERVVAAWGALLDERARSTRIVGRAPYTRIIERIGDRSRDRQ